MIEGPIRLSVLLVNGEHVTLHGEFCDFADGTSCKISDLADDIINDLTINDLIAIGAIKGELQLQPPPGYTADELERDNPYNQWMYES